MRLSISSYEALAPYVSRVLGIPSGSLEKAFRPAQETDLAGILALRRATIGRDMWWDDEAYIRWRYIDQTAGVRCAYWVFERKDEIIAGGGVESVALSIDGELHDAVRTGDLMARPDFEGRGLGAYIILILMREYQMAMVMGTNERSHRLVSRMFDHVLDLSVWKTALKSQELVEDRLTLGPATRTVTALADAALTFNRRIRRKQPPQDVVICELAAFDQRVTDLSKSCEGTGRIMVRRTAEYLNWRFLRNPRCTYRVLGAFDGDSLIGYVVTRLNLARTNPRTAAEIVDWLVSPVYRSSSSLLHLLIQAAVEQLARDGAHVISCAASDGAIPAAMKTNGFRVRPAEKLGFFVLAENRALQHRLRAPTDWFLTRGDLDVD